MRDRCLKGYLDTIFFFRDFAAGTDDGLIGRLSFTESQEKTKWQEHFSHFVFLMMKSSRPVKS